MQGLFSPNRVELAWRAYLSTVASVRGIAGWRWGASVPWAAYLATFLAFSVAQLSVAQGPATPAVTTPPSLQGGIPAGSPPGKAGGGALPQGNGQEHRVYDLRPYTGYLTKHDRPQQAVVDWILRETGTDLWFTEPFGFMSANRDSLSVYHTREVHEVIASMVERFTAGDKDPQVLNLRVLNVGSPNWRSRTHSLMQHVSVQTPGLQAWLLTKENAALVMATLRQRSDVREVQAVDLVTHNGQTEKLSSVRGRNYTQNVGYAPSGWPPYEPKMGEVQEGYRIDISPLLTVDRKALDCLIQIEIDQVDKLVPVDLELPLPSGQPHRARIDVPQIVSWRLKERFRWPTDMVLLISCGVVASPAPQSNPAAPFFNLNALTGVSAGRADALMFIEFRGKATENLPSTPQISNSNGNPTSNGTMNRGRY